MASTVPPPPPGFNYVVAIEPMLDLLLLDAVLASFLVPVTITLFYFSASTTRWKPVFLMNVAGIVFTLILSVVNVYNQTSAILARPVNRTMEAASVYMMILTPFCSELVLVLRVIAAYPLRFMYWRARILVYGPIAAFKIARVVNIVVFIIRWVPLERQAHDPFQLGQVGWNLVNVKIEWFLQFLDMTFVSVLFLARLRQGSRLKQLEDIPDSFPATLSDRIRTLFWIAASNLVIPALLTFIQLVYIFSDDDFLHGTYVFFVNIHVQILGVLLATIWSSGSQQPNTTLPIGATTMNGGHIGGGRECAVMKNAPPAGDMGLNKRIVSPSEWFSTWTARSDGAGSVLELDLEAQDPVKSPEPIGAPDERVGQETMTLASPTC